MKILVNGRISEKYITNIDTGYFYGYGVFETILINKSTPILINEHLTRLNKSALKLGIDKIIDIAEVESAIQKLGAYNIGLKINVSKENTVFSLRPITYKEIDYKIGRKLGVSPIRRNSTSPLVGIKSMNYMENILAIEKAKEEGYDKPLFINQYNEVCETATANIFVLIDGNWKTPKLECGLLPGIIRKWVMGIIFVEEVILTVEDVLESQGVFITNSLMGVMPVKEINKKTIKQSELVVDLMESYKKYIETAGEKHGLL